MRYKSILATLLVAALVFLAIPGIASAQSAEYCGRDGASLLGFPTWYKYLSPQFSNGECVLVNAKFPEAIPLVALAVFEILLRIAGFIAMIFVIYGGFQYLTSTGEPDKAKAARTTIINALVGVMIAMFATVIVNLIGRNLG